METSIVDQIEFNQLKTLKIIESDKLLDEIFRGEVVTFSYPMLYSLAKKNTLTPEIESRILEVFNTIIQVTEKYFIEYASLEDIIVEVPIPKKNHIPKLPKHYGKKRILNDILSSNKKTELDRMMLALNNLRNIYAKLKRNGIKDKLNGTNIFSDSDCRDIVAAIRIIDTKTKSILKKKK